MTARVASSASAVCEPGGRAVSLGLGDAEADAVGVGDADVLDEVAGFAGVVDEAWFVATPEQPATVINIAMATVLCEASRVRARFSCVIRARREAYAAAFEELQRDLLTWRRTVLGAG